MSSMVLELGGAFPWVHKFEQREKIVERVVYMDLQKPAPPSPQSLRDKLAGLNWVVLPDGRTGYIHHTKTDGNIGVRPVDLETGVDLPNTSPRWSQVDRLKIPEEIALSQQAVRAAEEKELPMPLRQQGI
jgi:hypothetical protein